MMARAPRRLDELADHIVATHHAYARRAIPDITDRLRIVVTLVGGTRPELALILQTFAHLGATLLSHMDKEEHLLFPYLRDLAAAEVSGGPLPPGPFGTVANPLRLMEDEHLDALRSLDCLRDLAHRYEAPAGAVPAIADAYAALAVFDADLRAHVRIEEHELYPRGLELEARLT